MTRKLTRTSRRLVERMADVFTYPGTFTQQARLDAWNAVDARLLKLENQVRRLKTQLHAIRPYLP